jgi:hypothetical protein
MHLALLKDALDLLRRDQRARGVVDRNIASITTEIFQTSTNGILSIFAAGDNGLDFFEALIATDLSDFIAPIFSRNDNDFGDGIGQLERVDRMRYHWFTGDCLEQFIKANAPAAARRNDNGREHSDWSLDA